MPAPLISALAIASAGLLSIETLGLTNPIYTPTAAYGHFGRKAEERRPDMPGAESVLFFPWEATDRADDIRTAAGA